MKLLILGGTVFPAAPGRGSAGAWARDHAVHRASTMPILFPQPRSCTAIATRPTVGAGWKLKCAGHARCGDRHLRLPAAVVRASAEALAGTAGHYTFISTISVYPHYRSRG
ncbi:MAG: hypothetical protein U0Z44_01865 [Kouleothrix sp.]